MSAALGWKAGRIWCKVLVDEGISWWDQHAASWSENERFGFWVNCVAPFLQLLSVFKGCDATFVAENSSSSFRPGKDIIIKIDNDRVCICSISIGRPCPLELSWIKRTYPDKPFILYRPMLVTVQHSHLGCVHCMILKKCISDLWINLTWRDFVMLEFLVRDRSKDLA